MLMSHACLCIRSPFYLTYCRFALHGIIICALPGMAVGLSHHWIHWPGLRPAYFADAERKDRTRYR